MELVVPEFGDFVPRNRLVSALLQDRGVLRLLSAPHGFGKSMLAYEYARRLFSAGQVFWVDARAPEFLHALDKGRIVSPETRLEESEGKLLVIDDIPYLDELRAKTLSDCIDTLLYKHVEVIATTLPSHDVLRSLQSDRLLFRAQDLLVDQVESDARHPSRTPEGGALRIQTWRIARERLFGRAPAVYFPDDEHAIESCLLGFFKEKLPLELLRAAFTMLLLRKGSFDELARLGTALGDEGELMLAGDYAFLGIDSTQRSFETADFPLDRLRSCIERAHIAPAVLGKGGKLVGRALALLMSKGQIERAGDVLDVFYSDEECALWLGEEGWDLLDCGEQALVDKLFERCPHELCESSLSLRCLRAWASGLAGDRREAAWFARGVLAEGLAEDAQPAERLAAACAYLALLAFDEGGPAVYDKGTYSTDEAPLCEADFFTSVVDACSREELSCAMCLGDEKRGKELADACAQLDEKRLRRLETLFTTGAERFGSSPWFCLSLHMLQAMPSVRMRSLLQELGCSHIARARRRGLTRLSEALLVCDLWKGGYFGVNSLRGTRRDTRLLEGARNVLARLGESLGRGPLPVPWKELDEREQEQETLAGAKVELSESFPILHVRLFGGFETAAGEHFSPESAWRKKPRILFTMLALRLGRDVTRDEIFAELWPNFSRKRALDNFYSTWSAMRANLGEGPYAVRNGEFCHINQRLVKSDVGEFDRLTRSLLLGHMESGELLDTYSQVESVYRGGLLPSERGSDYIDAQRQRYRQLFVDAMVTASFKAIEKHDVRLALWFARKAYEEEPRREDVYHALMRAQVEAGQRSSAIRSYERCRTFLREELGLDPSAEVQRLYDQVVTSDPALVGLAAGFAGR